MKQSMWIYIFQFVHLLFQYVIYIKMYKRHGEKLFQHQNVKTKTCFKRCNCCSIGILLRTCTFHYT